MQKENKELLQKGTWLGIMCSFAGIIFSILGQSLIGFVVAPLFLFMVAFLTRFKPKELVYPRI